MKVISIIILFWSLASFSNTLTEALPNGQKIVFYETDTSPLPHSELKKIKQGIETRLHLLHTQFKAQSPEKKLDSLIQFETHLSNTYENIKYRTGSALKRDILLLSHLLKDLPTAPTLSSQKNCQLETRRLKLRAYNLLKTEELPPWLQKMFTLTQTLCLKNKNIDILALL